jgi:predicted amidohydrolase YtcJ
LVSRFAIAFTSLLLCSSALCQEAPPDLVLLNGKIFTSDSAHPRAEALAIRGDRISAVGASNQIRALMGPQTKQIDLGGRLVVPGFNDAHIHLGVHPADLDYLDFKSLDPSWAEVSSAISAAVQKDPKSTLIKGDIGATVFNGPEATRSALDKLAPDHPVMLESFTGHAEFVNSAALTKLGITDGQRDPAGGKYERSADGRLNGAVREYAVLQLNRNLANLATDAEGITELRRTFLRATRFGITSMQDMSSAMSPDRAVALLQKVPTTIRVRVIRMALTTPQGRDTAEGQSLLKTAASPLIEVNGTKWMLDGTPIELTFAPRQTQSPGTPPSDHSFSDLGLTFPRGEIKAMLRESLKNDDQLLIHVAGYPAAAAILDAMESMGGKRVWAGRRLRFEHGDGLFPDLVPRAKELGIVVVQNPSHFDLGLGHELLQQAQPLKSLLDAGVPVALGSDGLMNPFVNIMLACSHPNRRSEAITIEQAVIAYTLTSAYAEFAEKDKGSLEPGKLADLAVLSQDILQIPLQDLPKTESVLTMVGGKIVYDAKIVNSR